MGIFTDVLSSFLLKYFYLSLIIVEEHKQYFQSDRSRSVCFGIRREISVRQSKNHFR